MTTLTEHYSDSILTKAERLIKAGKVHPDPIDSKKFIVEGSKPYAVYLIDLGEGDEGYDSDDMPYVTCGCPNGLARGGRPSCYHSAAVIKTILDAGKEEEESKGKIPDFLEFD